MARIRGKDTTPEMALRRLLWAAGIRYRLHARVGSATPDLRICGSPLLVFIDGCFWHGCPQHYVLPTNRREFWQARLEQNVTRDAAQTRALIDAGHRVLRVWEHEVFECPERVLAQVREALEEPRIMGERWVARRVDEIDAESRLERWHMIDLHDPARTREVVQPRSTRKWRRARPVPRQEDHPGSTDPA